MEGTRLSCSLPYRVNFVVPFLHVCKFNHFLSRVTIQIFQLLWLEIESLMSTWEWMYLEGKLLVVDNGTLGQGYRVSVKGNQLTDAPWNNMSCQGFQMIATLLSQQGSLSRGASFGQPTSPPCILCVATSSNAHEIKGGTRSCNE
ncbi:uncharacterized protein LOC133704406 isoform X1 [Populus nigra]|uniref:uncharacterized protein LOC133704406 isoform X1 n=1 Tax=Populus nigra TaxID=3691 RepID=UPI002B2750B9|nr:uncharacterized protein LOC133704406 isoform X1 [Populus nigra]